MIPAISNFNQNRISVNYTNNESKLGAYRNISTLNNSVDTFQKQKKSLNFTGWLLEKLFPKLDTPPMKMEDIQECLLNANPGKTLEEILQEADSVEPRGSEYVPNSLNDGWY